MRKDLRDILYNIVVGIPIAVVMYICYTRDLLSLEVMAIIAIVYVAVTQLFWFFWLKPRLLGRGTSD